MTAMFHLVSYSGCTKNQLNPRNIYGAFTMYKITCYAQPNTKIGANNRTMQTFRELF